jgi:tripeptidyl-peptidase-1
MTSEEVTDFFAPAQSSVDAVIDWLVSSGIAPSRISQSANKQASRNKENFGKYLSKSP